MPKQADANDERLWTPNSSLFRALTQSIYNPTLSNINVTPEDSLAISAYYCAVRAISEDIAKLPVKMFRKVMIDQKEFIHDDKLLTVLNSRFNDELDAMTGKQTLIQWMLMFGNAYAEISYNKAGDLHLYLIHPTNVRPQRNLQTKKIEYVVNCSAEVDRLSGKIKVKTFQSDQILHLKGAVGNGVVGYSVAEIAAQSLGISIAAENFTGSFFGNNLNVGAILETPGKLSPDLKEATRKEWKEQFRGSQAKEALAILPQNWKYQKIQMNSNDAELLKTRQFQILEIARWFRIPPHKIMEMMGAKFNNVEQQNIEYVTDCLGSWIARLEIQFKFYFHRVDNVFIDIDEKVLLRGDQAARTQYYKELYLMSAITPQDIAKIEGLPYEDAPNKYYQQLNVQSVTLTEESQNLDNEIKKKSLEEPDVIVPDPEPLEAAEEEPEEPEEDTIEESQLYTGIAPEAFLSNYRPIILKSIDLLIKKEYRAHEAANKKQGYALTEHLNKFYSKFNTELSDIIQMHLNCVCSMLSKEEVQRDDIETITQTICEMSKDSIEWKENRPSEVVDMLLSTVTDLQSSANIGDVLKGEDGKHYILTINGYKEFNATV